MGILRLVRDRRVVVLVAEVDQTEKLQVLQGVVAVGNNYVFALLLLLLLRDDCGGDGASGVRAGIPWVNV